MTAREELAAVLVCEWCSAAPGAPCVEWSRAVEHLHEGMEGCPGRLRVADTLLATPAFARVTREAKAEAWVEGWIDRDNYCTEPYSPRMHNPYQTEDPT